METERMGEATSDGMEEVTFVGYRFPCNNRSLLPYAGKQAQGHLGEHQDLSALIALIELLPTA